MVLWAFCEGAFCCKEAEFNASLQYLDRAVEILFTDIKTTVLIWSQDISHPLMACVKNHLASGARVLYRNKEYGKLSFFHNPKETSQFHTINVM